MEMNSLLDLVNFAGEDKKITKIGRDLDQLGCDFHVISDLESIARTLNLIGFDSGSDLLAVSYLAISQGRALLFIDSVKLGEGITDLVKDVEIVPYESFASSIAEISQNTKVLIDRTETSCFVRNALAESAQISYGRSPAAEIKQIKTKTELDYIEQTHIDDAIALTESFSQLREILRTQTISEYDLGQLIDEERSKRPGYDDRDKLLP